MPKPPFPAAAVLCVVSLYLAGCAGRARTTGLNPGTPNDGPKPSLPAAATTLPAPSDAPTPRPPRDPASGAAVPTTSRAAPPAPRAAPPFESEIVAFERADAQSPPPAGAVVFVGSSSIRLWKTLAADFADLPGAVPVLNRGFGGSQAANSVRHADRIVLPYRPSAVVLYAGDNDLAAGKSPQQVAADVRAFASKVHAKQPATPVLFLAIKPSLARRHLLEEVREANRLVMEFAEEDGHVDYVDVFTPMLTPNGEPRGDLLVADGLHLNADGYELWTSILRPHLDRALSP